MDLPGQSFSGVASFRKKGLAGGERRPDQATATEGEVPNSSAVSCSESMSALERNARYLVFALDGERDEGLPGWGGGQGPRRHRRRGPNRIPVQRLGLRRGSERGRAGRSGGRAGLEEPAELGESGVEGDIFRDQRERAQFRQGVLPGFEEALFGRVQLLVTGPAEGFEQVADELAPGGEGIELSFALRTRRTAGQILFRRGQFAEAVSISGRETSSSLARRSARSASARDFLSAAAPSIQGERRRAPAVLVECEAVRFEAVAELRR